MKNIALLFMILCTFFFPIIFLYQSGNYRNERISRNVVDIFSNSSEPVNDLWNLTVPALLIDLDLLKCLDDSNFSINTGRPIRIGVDKKYQSEITLLENSQFQIVYFSNDSTKDFLDFDIDGRRIIPRRFKTRWMGNMEIPNDVQMFSEFWKRSKFIPCLGLKIQRKKSEIFMPAQQASDVISQLRDELIDNKMFPFLMCGTLLGWYRECSVIPHTRDMDMGVTAENYNPEYLEKLEKSETGFKILRKLGNSIDSLELTVIPNSLEKPRTDLFILYNGVENETMEYSYITGLGGDGTKYQYVYTEYNSWCVGEMHGHYFWVACNSEKHLTKEYGSNWRQDHPSETYTWNKSGKNIRTAGKFSEKELKDAYKVYRGAEPYLS